MNAVDKYGRIMQRRLWLTIDSNSTVRTDMAVEVPQQEALFAVRR
jgi:hypothetical protein